ncbi:MAG TPA: hypothetical protein PKY82_34365 [Pyrinomonadaceae bacterium]|nr:hypothetical protein [Pyrinomonadaceae bacterium]
MKKGICVKCGSSSICTAEMGFQQDNYTLKLGDSMFSETVFVKSHDYICTECGYYEQYIEDKGNLKKIAELAAGNIRGWSQVPVS